MTTKTIIIALTILTFNSCDSKKNIQETEVKEIEMITDKRISILGDPTTGILMVALNKIDSVNLTSVPKDFTNLDFTINENRLITNVMRVGNYPFEAKVYSNDKVYLLTDTLKIRPPSANIYSEFGHYLIAGEDNWISVCVNGYLQEEITISSNKGEFTKQGPSRYLLEPLEEGLIEVSAFIKFNGKQRIIATQNMLVVHGTKTFNELITSANTSGRGTTPPKGK